MHHLSNICSQFGILLGIRSHFYDAKLATYWTAEEILRLWTLCWQDLLYGDSFGLFILDLFRNCVFSRRDWAGSAFPLQEISNIWIFQTLRANNDWHQRRLKNKTVIKKMKKIGLFHYTNESLDAPKTDFLPSLPKKWKRKTRVFSQMSVWWCWWWCWVTTPKKKKVKQTEE